MAEYKVEILCPGKGTVSELWCEYLGEYCVHIVVPGIQRKKKRSMPLSAHP